MNPESRYRYATHEVMALVQAGTDLQRATYQAAMKFGLGLTDYGRLVIEADQHIPALLASGELTPNS